MTTTKQASNRHIQRWQLVDLKLHLLYAQDGKGKGVKFADTNKGLNEMPEQRLWW